MTGSSAGIDLGDLLSNRGCYGERALGVHEKSHRRLRVLGERQVHVRLRWLVRVRVSQIADDTDDRDPRRGRFAETNPLTEWGVSCPIPVAGRAAYQGDA